MVAQGPINDVPVLGDFDFALGNEIDHDVAFYVALGEPENRVRTYEKLKDRGRKLATIIFPNVEVLTQHDLGEGIYIGAFSLISVGVKIADFVIIHSFVNVAPNVTLGKGCWVAPSCTFSRDVEVGAATFVGTGATVLPEVKIGAHCTIGAGSLVTKDIPDNSVAYGSPCRVVRENS